MSLEPELPFEFVVTGTAISSQSSTRSKEAWRQAIRLAARLALPADCWLLTEALAVTVFIFPTAKMQGDVDNRLKPILDAMVGCVYSDDDQIERIVIQKFEPERVFAFQSPTSVLLTALAATQPVVYIRLSRDLHEELR